MKLLCVVPSYWPAFRFGGPIFAVHGLNKALVKKGIDVTVYTTNVGLQGKVPVNQEVDVDGVKVTYFGFTRFFEILGTTGWQFSLPMIRALKSNLKSFDIVYIVAIWNFPSAVAAHYCRKYKKPYIISPRGTLYLYTAGKKSWKKWPYYHLIAKRDLENASAVHYTTEDEAEKCHSYLTLKNRAIIIPNGIDPSEFNDLPPKEGRLRERYPILKDRKVILFLSRINWKKGLDILVKAYGRLAREEKDLHLLIAGFDEDGYEKTVRGWLKDEGVWEQVTFAGALDGKNKLEAFAGTDLFVLPSYSENFGMAVVEAMACGLPVVISNKVGIHREVEKNNAGIVVETTPESLYRGIKILLSDENLIREIAKNGKQLVEEYYDINKVVDAMVESCNLFVKRQSG